MKVLVASYNAGQHGGLKPDDFTPLLAPSDLQSEPDLVVVGIQEMAPLPIALLGLTGLVEYRIKEACSKALAHWETQRKTEAYIELGSSVHGNCQLLLYARRDLAKSTQLAWSRASCGFGWLLSNKGSISARVTINNSETFTFCNAHLSPHPQNVGRRNLDYQTIVRRTSFGSAGLYDSNHIIFFGDLNYRLDKQADKLRDQEQLFWPVDAEKRLQVFMEHEQLSIERSQGRTAHGLQEAPVHFKPTYKYVPKKASVLDKSRAPAWCDRILFGSTGVIDAQVYSSVMSFTQSDHRPVYALLDITAPQDAASTLPTPFTPDNLRTPKLYLGDTFGLLVGALWSAVSLIGGGYDLAGVFVVGCSAIGFLAAYYMAIW